MSFNMPYAQFYHPVWFYLITILTAVVIGPIAAHLSQKWQAPLILLSLCIPCITALTMIYGSHQSALIGDFHHRLLLFKFNPKYLLMILFLMPAIVCLATGISLLFGYTTDQFVFSKAFGVMKGWAILGIILPLLLAPLIEELGWRGYGVDSLRVNFNLFTTSVIFGLLWAIWHLPAFFIEGYYQNQLWHENKIYALNFFVSVFVVAFLINWVYYKTGRSIPAIVLFHAVLNFSMMALNTQQFTKCIATLVLCIITIFVIVNDRSYFFEKSFSNQRVKAELNHLQKQYGFPGATVAYVLPDGTVNEVSCGVADLETKVPMTPKSRMLAASIGKTFVAAEVIALAKEGRIHLDDPLSKWLGERNWYKRLSNHETITLRHLLTHSAGLADHAHIASFQKTHFHEAAPEELVEYILDQPPLYKPGNGWAYTDTGYILLGLVIEKAIGNSYSEEVERRFFKPLKLDTTSLSDTPHLPGLIAGYTAPDNPFGLPIKTIDQSGVMVWNPAVEWTGGGIISTSHDLALWAKMLYEGRAMPYDYLGDLLQSVPAVGSARYGAAVVITQNARFGEIWGHYGVIPGYTSSVRYYPKYGIAIAFQINSDKDTPDYIGIMEQRLAKAILS